MKKKIAIVCGGDSGEIEVSLKSAEVVKRNLNSNLYDGYTIVIKGKDWFCEHNGTKITIDKNDFTVSIEGNRIVFDCVFNAIHGTPGEDGILQGYFDLMRIPHTSSGVFASALTFNKEFANIIVKDFGVNVAKSMVLSKNDDAGSDLVLSKLTLPCFVKPNEGGSSIGVTKVKEAIELEEAVKTALAEDNEVMIEEFIEGTEITCGVLKIGDTITALPITEIVTEHDFFNYTAKYTKGEANEITPARISKEVEAICKETSIKLYSRLKCSGVVRFDYIWSQNKLFFLEVNTVPGLSEASIVPQQAEVYGLSIEELFTLLIEQALNDYQQNSM